MTTRPKAKNGDAPPPSDFLGDVGRHVNAARLAAGLNLAELGERAGVATSYIYEIEQKGTNLTLNALKRLADALEVSPRDLLPAMKGEGGSVVRLAALISALEAAAGLLQKRRAEDESIAQSLLSLVGDKSPSPKGGATNPKRHKREE